MIKLKRFLTRNEKTLTMLFSIVSIAISIGIQIPTIYEFIDSRKSKTAIDVVISGGPFLQIGHDQFGEKLKVLYDDEELPLQHTFVGSITIRNSGTQVIRPEDFYEPITVEYPENLHMNILATSFEGSLYKVDGRPILPKSSDIIITKNGLTVPPFLLNPGDSVRILYLANLPNTDIEGELKVQTRIAGISSPNLFTANLTHELWYQVYGQEFVENIVHKYKQRQTLSDIFWSLYTLITVLLLLTFRKHERWKNDQQKNNNNDNGVITP